MWYPTFEQRLADWTRLRDQSAILPVNEYLAAVNDWWHNTPWTPYYLHWDDKDSWPCPWDLLADNIFCPLSRALGIIYTIAIAPHRDIYVADLSDVGGDNLVIVNDGLYTLNYSVDTIINIKLPTDNVIRTVSLEQIKRTIE